MPNRGHVVKCPFYLSHRKKSVTCEDVCRTFWSVESQNEWMRKYCDHDWKMCVFASALLEAYDKLDEGFEGALIELRAEAQEREVRKLKSMLGKQENIIKKLREDNRILREKLEAAEKDMDMFLREVADLTKIYEGRFSFLMTREDVPNGTLDEAEFQEWYKDHKDIKIVSAKRDENGKTILWGLEKKGESDE